MFSSSGKLSFPHSRKSPNGRCSSLKPCYQRLVQSTCSSHKADPDARDGGRGAKLGRVATLAGLSSLCGLLSARVKKVDVVGNSWAEHGGIVGPAVSVLML